MVKINWSDQAKLDLMDIMSYIAKDKFETGSLFAQRIAKSVRHLRNFPKFGRVVPESPKFREIIFGNYRIVYRILSESVIEIVTVHHSARILHID